MALAAFKRVVTKVFELNQLQANVAAIFDQLRITPFITGQRFTKQVITTGGTKLFHTLGYTPSGFLVTNQSGAGVVYMTTPTATVANPTTDYLILQASANVTVDLWVF